MTGERTLQARAYVPATDRDSEETLRFPFAVVLHLVPGALLLVTVLILAPPLVERGVPYELIHIAAGLLTIVPFMFGAMLLYGRRKHGRLTLRGWCSSGGPCLSGSTRHSSYRCSRSPSRLCSPPRQ